MTLKKVINSVSQLNQVRVLMEMILELELTPLLHFP